MEKMGIWPFRRKSSRRKQESGVHNSLPDETMNHAAALERHNTGEISPSRKRSRKGGRGSRRGSTEPKKLQRHPEKRTFSFSPSRDDTIRVPKNSHRDHPVPPIPPREAMKAQTWSAAGAAIDNPNAQGWQRVPTLHKRSAQDLPRRKSSKKRKEDHDREEEIKAMTASMPVRPATFDDLVGRPMKKDSKRMKDGLNRNMTNPSSDISLPLQESMHSSMSSTSGRQTSWQLKSMFSPHPTIRYSENPRYMPGASGFGLETSDSRRKNIFEREAIPESTLKAHKRIDDLADDLDAGDLRELMERDTRRKDRKKVADQKKMERRLARRAEKLKAAELEAARNGTPPPKNMERGVLGREGLGIDTGGTSPVRRRVSNASSRRMKRPADVAREDSAVSNGGAFTDFYRAESLPPTEAGSPFTEKEEPILATAQVAHLSRANMSPPSSPKGHNRDVSNISQMMDLNDAQQVPIVSVAKPESKPDSKPKSKPEPVRNDSALSTRQTQSWTSFFKRSSKQKRASIPSSFSNTSRDSALASRSSQTYENQRSTSSIPRRTMSKFREDLPDFPISPPDSRVQSPEADVVPPIHTGFPEKRGGGRGSSENPVAENASRRHDTPTSGYRSLEAASRLKTETPTSGHRSMDAPSPVMSAIMSQSMASVDSEGSWLTGRPRAGSKRASLQNTLHPLHNSANDLETRYKEFSDSQEEIGIAEDEYFSRLTPGADEMFETTRQRRSGNPMPSSDEEDGDSIASPISSRTKWGAVARRPTLVESGDRTKSREGILNSFDSDSEIADSPTTPQEKLGEFKRATSVTLGPGHARHISAGSAKLLDVKPRVSGDSRRISSE